MTILQSFRQQNCIRIPMKSHSESQFERFYTVFKTREKEIPVETRAKMFFMASLIHDQPFNSSPHYHPQSPQAQELSLLDKKSLTILFNTLVKTLLMEKKAMTRQLKVKFNSFFQFWKDATSYIDKKLFIITCERLVYKYKMAELSIGNCRRSKKYFQIYQNNRSALSIKMISNESFDDFLSYLQSSIDESKSKGTQNQTIQILQKYQMEQPRLEEESEKSQVFISRGEMVNSKRKESHEIESLANLSDVLKKEVIQGYHIVQEADNIYMLQAEKEPKIHISLILKTNSELSKLVDFYLQQKEWNSTIVSQHITSVEENVLQIFRVFKKDSMFQMQRATLTHAKVFCSKNSATITEQTLNHGKKDNKLVCSVSSNTTFKRCLGGVQVTFICSFDGKGYYTLKDSCEMLKKWTKDIKYLQNNFTLSQLQRNNLKVLVTKDNRLSISPYKFGSMKKEEEPFRMILEKQVDLVSTNDTLDLISRDTESNLQKLFYKLRPVRPDSVPSDDYIKLTMNRLNQRYYLKHRFDQSNLTKYDVQVPHYCLQKMIKRKDYKVSEKKQLIFINQEVIDGQKDSLIFVIKQIGANIVTGKSVLNVSLPVDIFESRSLLERSAAAFGIVPDYLIPVAEADPLTQMKNIITLVSTLPILELVMLKPFNPILGQTFQAYIKGIPIYYEQISHHPPISSFYMICEEFTMYGNLVAFADVSINSAVGGNEGLTYIKMKNGNEYQCSFPPCQISGLIFGERSFREYGKGFILSKKHNLVAQISIEKAKKGLYQKGNIDLFPGTVLGGIFRVKPHFMSEIAKQQTVRKYTGLTVKDVDEKLASIRGIWFQDIYIDNQIMNKNIKIYPLEYSKIALPSDSNYREDVLFHKMSDIPRSQKEKEVLEVRQRADKKLREKTAKLMKKKK